MKSHTRWRVFFTIFILLALAARAPADYCSASGDEYYYYEYICQVVVGDIDNISGQSGYADYTHLSTTMQTGVGYEIEVTNNYDDYDDECGIWVDWNQDEDFDDADEQITVSGSPGTGPYTATITPPESALAGDTRMRIRITWDETPLPCGDTTYGEVEDYTITVSAGGYCSASGGCVDYISDVYMGTINNTGTGCDGYADYTSLSTTMEIGTGYPITVVNDEIWYGAQTCSIWVDWNQDDDFYDVNEQITIDDGSYPFTATITPPADANLGDTRMRIRIRSSGEPQPCGNTDGGEVEDYTIEVVIPPPTFTISGCIRLSDGSPLGSVLTTSSPGGVTDITDANGYYEITLNGPWTGYLDRYKQGWVFTLPRYYIDVTTDQTEDVVAFWPYSGGFGISDMPYLIATPNDMNAIGAHPEDWDKYFKLVNDIDLSAYTGTEFSIIGTSISKTFSGVFDGSGHTISNFTYTVDAGLIEKIGLFGYVTGDSTEIKNLILKDPNIICTGTFTEGTLVGMLSMATISDCRVEGGNISGFWSGGLVGENNYGIIENCCFSGNVAAGGAGGLISHNNGGIVFRCYSEGTVSGFAAVGGLVGQSSSWSLITDCYSKSSVTGLYDSSSVGGLVGYDIDSSIVERCYSVGKVFGIGSDTGGLIGCLEGGSVTNNSFWDVQTSGQEYSDGGTGLQTYQMQMSSIFTDAGWDFNNHWTICEGTNYPRLRWQVLLSADFLCPEGVDFLDYSYFSGYWLDTNCALSNDCNGTDFDLSGVVDGNDLKFFTDSWLTGR